MNNLFKLATELVLIRNSSDLLAKAKDVLRQELEIESIYILQLSVDGRYFELTKDERSLAWSVSDFDHPFSHALHSANSLTLHHNDLLYWQSNHNFNNLIGAINELSSVVILPLFSEGKKLQALLVLHIKKGEALEVGGTDEFQYFLSVLGNHLQILHEMEGNQNDSHQLLESLEVVKEKKIKHDKADLLANTLIGNSDLMKKLRKQVVTAASSNLSVMIQGETGTGKELVSRAVHDFSSRNNAGFIAINCAAIPEHLLESELFGYVKGAFSGADKDKKGLIADANGGTLFLDEIGDMSLALQAKLLRVLESRTYRPVGADKELKSDFRLVVATHLNLKELVTKNRFRKDLYYRVYQYPITLPNLRERTSDVEELSHHFIKQYNQENNFEIRGLSYKTLDYLKDYKFPGNVRELKHLIEFGCAQTNSNEQILLHTVSPKVEGDISEETIAEMSEIESINDLKFAVKEFETIIITARLCQFKGDRTKAAESLGVPKRTLADKCLKLGIVLHD